MGDTMKCFHPTCTVSPRTGGAVFRINAKGQPAIWACREHMKATDAPPIDPVVDEIVRTLEVERG
jgi:hypothetical protein